MKVETMDLDFMGTEGIIASFLLTGGGTAAIIETGPANCIESLMRGIEDRGVAPEDVEKVLLTHIHLDHSGASGHLAERLPNATFYVHEVGYPHLVDPSKLLKSAARIYGEENMNELFGEARPVPEDRLVKLQGGEEIEVADGLVSAHYTPGHAYHHLAFHEPQSGTLFAGDVAGVRLHGQSYVKPPTPPPEVDIEAWKGSIESMRKLAPKVLCPTHFGSYEDVERHLSELEQRLEDWLLLVEERMDEGQSQEDIIEELEAKGDAEMLREGADPKDSERYELAANYEMLVTGLMRYVSRQRESA
ncbi:MAG: MBL-fold metallo-hydrolase superfamily [uncultured Rubrobacteraceae bacterium]|uniref:MBL-fold metallo-hydrolase superfamily n=1 Tax=uncultured Rubrobacteraceae bacterium TaxID=349277 RepID=A0A6J4QMC7_9ACTN|nr:MAG: MBL-fold metallo-hydrolase superfamily [uncultured Rubrobacteraceae bacterium]